MKQKILERIDSVVNGYVNQHATDWTEIDRPLVERCDDSVPFLVMMRSSGVDVAFFAGEHSTMENAFHSQAALPNHELFLHYNGQDLKSVNRFFAEKLCAEAAERYENLELPMDGFRKAVERCSDDASAYPESNRAAGECGPWRVSLSDRQTPSRMMMEVYFESKCVARGFCINDNNFEFGRYHNMISDKTFNEMFDVLHSEFPAITKDFNERKRSQAAKQEVSK